MATKCRLTWDKQSQSSLVVKEGFLNKKGCVLKCWSSKYFMLNKQSLVYFHHREQPLEEGSSLSPQGRIFLSDLVSVERESDAGDKKACQLILHTKKHRVKLQASSQVERDGWVDAIMLQRTLESEGEGLESEGEGLESEGVRKSGEVQESEKVQELGEPLESGDSEAKVTTRRSLRKLPPGLKRVTLSKDPVKGIGCTIKSAAGHIFVNSITEGGPIAFTGVLRPDDELLDVNGESMAGKSVADVGTVIHNCPDKFLAIIRPVSALKKHHRRHATNIQRVNYATKMAAFSPPTPPITPPTPTSSPALNICPSPLNSCSPTLHQETPPGFGVDLSGIHRAYSESSVSNDDMGDYDDEEEDHIDFNNS